MKGWLRRIFGLAPSPGGPSTTGVRRAYASSEERFRLLVDSVREYAIFILDPDGRVSTWNAGAERINGYTADEILGKQLDVFYPPEDAAAGRPQRELDIATETGKYEEEGWRVRKDGTRFWASVVVTALRKPDGELAGFAKITRDMTERLRAEENSRRLLQEEAARKAAEAAREESDAAHREERRRREELRVTLQSIGDAVIVTDREGHATFLNGVAEALTGWAAADAAGRPCDEIFHIVNEETRKLVESPVGRVLRENVVVGLANHTVLLARDGREVPIDDSGAPIRDEAGEVLGVVLVFRDVTEARRAAAVQRHLAAIVESSDDAIISKALDGTIVSWNRGAERLYGYSSEEMVGQPIARLVPPNQPDELPSIMERLKRGERVEHFETIRIRRDGTPLQVSLTISPVRDDYGRVVGASKIARDITEQKRTEASLRFLAQASSSLAALGDHESALHGISRLAVPAFADACIVDMTVGDGSLRRLAVSPESVAGPQLDASFPADPDASWGPGRVLRTGMAELVAGDAVAPDALVRSSISAPIKARGRVLGVLSFLSLESHRRFDASDLRLAEDVGNRAGIAIENSRLYGEVKAADRRKDEFLAMLAHELRNPLAPIRTSLEVMRQAPTLEALEPSRQIAERQVAHLARLVDDLLDVSRIMQGRVELRKERTDLGSVLRTAAETAKPLLDARRQRLEIALPAQPVPLDADPTRLAQVFSNILNNAAKFSPRPGVIRIDAAREGDIVVVRVKDEGAGIEPALLPHVFDLFIQGDTSLERTQGGLGIGLTVVRNLVALHGGRVAIRSAGRDQGTEVVVRLPVAVNAAPAGDAVAGEAGESRSLRILVVDDSIDAAEASAILLRAWGHSVQVAHDGMEALQVATDLRPELVLLDIGLPGMNGYEVAKHLRHRTSTSRSMLVAVTGYGQDEDRRKAEEAGFDRHLTKPVDPGVLRELIASIR